MPAGQIHLQAKNGCYIFTGLLEKKKECMATKPKIFPIWSFIEKCC